MKKLLLSLLVTGISLTSCKSDDDSPSTDNSELLGKWQWTSTDDTKWILSECDKENTFEFKDKTLIIQTHNDSTGECINDIVNHIL